MQYAKEAYELCCCPVEGLTRHTAASGRERKHSKWEGPQQGWRLNALTDWLTESTGSTCPHGNRNKQLPLPACWQRGGVGGNWPVGYGWLVKMQGFSWAKLDSGFGFSTLVFLFTLHVALTNWYLHLNWKFTFVRWSRPLHSHSHCGHSGVIHIKYRIFLISRRISILRFGARLRRQLDDVASFAWHSTLIPDVYQGRGVPGPVGEWLKLHNLHYEITFLLFYFSLFSFFSFLFHFHFYYYYIFAWPQSTR